MGLHRAGFQVTGVDIEPQPRYPFDFVLGDALEYVEKHGHEFDLIVAGPPCQAYSVTKGLSNGNHPDLVGVTRHALQVTGKPYIIENVPGAPLINPIKLCGTMFPGLRVIRHRLFECWPIVWFPPSLCQHLGRRAPKRLVDENGNGIIHSFQHVDLLCVVGNNFKVADGRIAMGIDWMTGKELSQAIPPAYAEWLAKQIIKLI